MSLATRCTTCGTVFRVVQDQLKISEGWVRCGRCNEVFNALEGLFDLDRESPPEWQPPAGRTGPAASVTGTSQVDLMLPGHADEPEEPVDPFLVERMDQQIFGSRSSTAAAPAPPPKAAKARVQLPRPGSHVDLEPPDPREPIRYEPELETREPSPDIDLSRIETLEVEPEFIRRAEEAVRWRRSPRRAMLAGIVALLGLGLAAQWAIHYRDFVATRWPATAEPLASLCASIGCTVSPLRRIEGLSVESSALARAPGTADAFRLSITLRNRESMPLALPSVDLTLTDASGQLVARRALGPKDFRVAETVIAAHAEQSMQLLLSTSAGRVAGYTVEIFYP